MMRAVGLNRTIRVGSLLTIFLFIMSASISATLDRLERAPGQSQLAIFGRGGRELAVYRGDLAQLQAADAAAMPRQTVELRRVHVMIVHREYRLL
jgi:hypothetical protein